MPRTSKKRTTTAVAPSEPSTAVKQKVPPPLRAYAVLPFVLGMTETEPSLWCDHLHTYEWIVDKDVDGCVAVDLDDEEEAALTRPVAHLSADEGFTLMEMLEAVTTLATFSVHAHRAGTLCQFDREDSTISLGEQVIQRSALLAEHLGIDACAVDTVTDGWIDEVERLRERVRRKLCVQQEVEHEASQANGLSEPSLVDATHRPALSRTERPAECPALDKDHELILKAHANQRMRQFTQSELLIRTRMGEHAIRNCVKDLLGWGLLDRPTGKKRRSVISGKGIDTLNELSRAESAANSPSKAPV